MAADDEETRAELTSLLRSLRRGTGLTIGRLRGEERLLQIIEAETPSEGFRILKQGLLGLRGTWHAQALAVALNLDGSFVGATLTDRRVAFAGSIGKSPDTIEEWEEGQIIELVEVLMARAEGQETPMVAVMGGAVDGRLQFLQETVTTLDDWAAMESAMQGLGHQFSEGDDEVLRSNSSLADIDPRIIAAMEGLGSITRWYPNEFDDQPLNRIVWESKSHFAADTIVAMNLTFVGTRPRWVRFGMYSQPMTVLLGVPTDAEEVPLNFEATDGVGYMVTLPYLRNRLYTLFWGMEDYVPARSKLGVDSRPASEARAPNNDRMTATLLHRARDGWKRRVARGE